MGIMRGSQASDECLLKQIDHVGIAVHSLDRALELYYRLFKARPTHIEVLDEFSVRIAFISIGEVMLELIEPLVPGKGRIGELLKVRGEGFDHIAYRVNGLENILLDMKKRGVRLRDKKVQTGVKGSRILFIDPEETGNVLTELVETEGGESPSGP
jgi:methylmalonyl-CoA/ethylmalonyl-CoA epimerase